MVGELTWLKLLAKKSDALGFVELKVGTIGIGIQRLGTLYKPFGTEAISNGRVLLCMVQAVYSVFYSLSCMIRIKIEENFK